MKRKPADNVLLMRGEYPYKNSPQSLTLESEIKRIAREREESIEETISKLCKLSGIKERQIYNYRNGKTDIPSGLIPVFCQQFGSNALAMSILRQCGATEEFELFDLVKLASETAQQTLETHRYFLEIFDDGKIDGFEKNEAKKKTATTVASFHRMEQIVEDTYDRQRAA